MNLMLSVLWFLINVSVCPAVEGMKVVEIEKCRNDIKKLREEMASRNNRWQQQQQQLSAHWTAGYWAGECWCVLPLT